MMQVDGTKGSAVVSLRDCWIQPYNTTPKPVWNPDIPQPIDFYEGWQKMPEQENFDNAFKVQWELFLKHIVLDEPFAWDLLEGARGVQLAGLALQSWAERRWVDVPELG
jgi:predicted dehydrogenase